MELTYKSYGFCIIVNKSINVFRIIYCFGQYCCLLQQSLISVVESLPRYLQ